MSINLIPPDEISELKAASVLQTVAGSAMLDQEKIAVAKTINIAANCGKYKAIYTHFMSSDMISTLEGLGYTVKETNTGSKSPYLYTISW